MSTNLKIKLSFDVDGTTFIPKEIEEGEYVIWNSSVNGYIKNPNISKKLRDFIRFFK